MPLISGLATFRRQHHSERGATLAITAVLMAALMLFSAVVIDVGQVMMHRRQDQSAADVAVIAAVWDRHNEAAMRATVVDMLNANLDSGPPFTEAELDTCAPEPMPAGWSRYPNTNCIAHDATYTELRLRLPTRTMQTSFAKLGGIDTLSHTAFAQVRFGFSSDVLPYALPADAGPHQCLKAGTSSLPDSLCDDNTQGNFGDVIFYTWGRNGTTKDCTGSTSQYPINLAQGLDHELSVYTAGAALSSYDNGGVEEPDVCGNFAARPNAAEPASGNQPQLTGDGLLYDTGFPDGGPARLQRLSDIGWFQTIQLNNGSITVDHTPLWEFIDPTLNWSDDVPRSCWKRMFVGDAGGLNPDNDMYMTNLPKDVADYLLTFNTGDRMIKLFQRCFEHYENREWDDFGRFSGNDTHWPTICTGVCTDALFTRNTDRTESPDIYDIQASPRFAYVPMLYDWSSMSDKIIAFQRFKAVYLHRYYTDSMVVDAGVGTSADYTAKNQKKVEALTAFVIPDSALPDGLGDPDAAVGSGKNAYAELTR